MSMTAFPVLARILTRARAAEDAPSGSVTIACAAVDDVTAWCILAVVVVDRPHGGGDACRSRSCSAGRCVYVRLHAHRWSAAALRRLEQAFETARRTLPGHGRHRRVSGPRFGLDDGATRHPRAVRRVPRGRGDAARTTGSCDRCWSGFEDRHGRSCSCRCSSPSPGCGPASACSISGELWVYCALIIAVAVLGKLGGSALAARTSGMSWRDSGPSASLMNTRGLMELVVLNIGLRHRGDLAGAVRDDGADGAGHDVHDVAGACADLPGAAAGGGGEAGGSGIDAGVRREQPRRAAARPAAGRLRSQPFAHFQSRTSGRSSPWAAM